MSRLVARILLAILMLPAAGAVCLVVFLAADAQGRFVRGPYVYHLHWNWALSGAASFVFVCLYWWALWRGAVIWNGRRLWGTVVAGCGSFLVGLISAGISSQIFDQYRSDWVGVILAPLAWLFATTILWRETPTERRDRLRAAGKGAVVCPSCGYNLTGLQGTRCPECGTLCTIDEIVAGQPSQATADISD